MIESQDQHVRKLMEFLREIGELDNTLVIFLSENGPEGQDIEEKLSNEKPAAWFEGVSNPDINAVGRGGDGVTVFLLCVFPQVFKVDLMWLLPSGVLRNTSPMSCHGLFPLQGVFCNRCVRSSMLETCIDPHICESAFIWPSCCRAASTQICRGFRGSGHLLIKGALGPVSKAVFCMLPVAVTCRIVVDRQGWMTRG